MYTFPDNSKLAKVDLVDKGKENASIIKTKTCQVAGMLICVCVCMCMHVCAYTFYCVCLYFTVI